MASSASSCIKYPASGMTFSVESAIFAWSS